MHGVRCAEKTCEDAAVFDSYVNLQAPHALERPRHDTCRPSSAASAPANYTLRSVIIALFPTEYAECEREALAARSAAARLPLMTGTEPLLPGAYTTLHVGEDRYLALLRLIAGPDMMAHGFVDSAAFPSAALLTTGMSAAMRSGSICTGASAVFFDGGVGGHGLQSECHTRSRDSISGGDCDSEYDSDDDGSRASPTGQFARPCRDLTAASVAFSADLPGGSINASIRSQSTSGTVLTANAATSTAATARPSPADSDKTATVVQPALTRRFGFVAKASTRLAPTAGDVGCIADIVALRPLQDGTVLVRVRGVDRFR